MPLKHVLNYCMAHYAYYAGSTFHDLHTHNARPQCQQEGVSKILLCKKNPITWQHTP